MAGVYTIQVSAKHNRDADWNLLSLPLEKQWIYFIGKSILLEFHAHVMTKSLCIYCKDMASSKICHL